jgi:hypothetical protein
MKFVAVQDEGDEICLTLRSECQRDKVQLLWQLAQLKNAAGNAENENSGSTKGGS